MTLKKEQKYKKSKGKVDWQPAPDISSRVDYLVSKLDLDWVKTPQVHCYRSTSSKARAHARIWGLPTLWQEVLGTRPHYIIEVISEKFDYLPERKRDEILLHEIAHIPKTFSGSLTPHTHKRKGSFQDKLKGLIAAYDRIRE